MSTAPQLRGSLKKKAPGLRIERELWESGAQIVVGIDEPRRPMHTGGAVEMTATDLAEFFDSGVPDFVSWEKNNTVQS